MGKKSYVDFSEGHFFDKKAHQFHVKETKINILVQEPDRPIKDTQTLYFSETSYQVDLKTKMLPGKKMVRLSILQTDILQTKDYYVR